MTAFAWLNDLAQWILRLLPRLSLVPATETPVVFGLSGTVSKRPPGLVFWWPVIHILNRVPTTLQSISIASRSMPAKDVFDRAPVPRAAVWGMSVQYRIADPVKASLASTSHHALIENILHGAVSEAWTNTRDAPAIIPQAVAGAAPRLADLGFIIVDAKLTHLCEAIAIMKFDDVAYADPVVNGATNDTETP